MPPITTVRIVGTANNQVSPFSNLSNSVLVGFTASANSTYTCVTPGLFSYQASVTSSHPTDNPRPYWLDAVKNGVVIESSRGQGQSSVQTSNQRSALRGSVRLATGNTFRINTSTEGGESNYFSARLTVLRVSA